jgi:hypothetical protein
MPGNFVKWTKDNTTLHPTPTAPQYMFPSGRSGNEWDGLMYGPYKRIALMLAQFKVRANHEPLSIAVV